MDVHIAILNRFYRFGEAVDEERPGRYRPVPACLAMPLFRAHISVTRGLINAFINCHYGP